MAKVKHKFGSTYYETKGRKSDGIPLICLHGGPGGTSMGHRELLKLSKDRKVFIYDQIGAGRSTEIKPSQYKIETFVKELDYLLAEWGVKEFHLLGSSWGTTLALEYFLRKKGKGVKSITFQSPMFSAKDWQEDANELIKKMPAKTQKVINYCHEIEATDSKVYKKAVFDYYLRHVLRNEKKLKSKSKIKNEHGNKVYEAMWGPSEFKATGTLKNYNEVKSLKRLDVPVLFLCGQYDEATPKTTKKFSQMVTGAKFKVIKKASHAILAEQPKEMLKTVKEFLNSIN
jgi:proline iminopeptidase